MSLRPAFSFVFLLASCAGLRAGEISFLPAPAATSAAPTVQVRSYAFAGEKPMFSLYDLSGKSLGWFELGKPSQGITVTNFDLKQNTITIRRAGETAPEVLTLTRGTAVASSSVKTGSGAAIPVPVAPATEIPAQVRQLLLAPKKPGEGAPVLKHPNDAAKIVVANATSAKELEALFPKTPAPKWEHPGEMK